MIKPTVGRVVWYHEKSLQGGSDQPLAAIIARVWSDTGVNLMVIDPNGNTQSRTSVLLLGENMERPVDFFAEWMPYQKGQAAKNEALEAKIGEAEKQ